MAVAVSKVLPKDFVTVTLGTLTGLSNFAVKLPDQSASERINIYLSTIAVPLKVLAFGSEGCVAERIYRLRSFEQLLNNRAGNDDIVPSIHVAKFVQPSNVFVPILVRFVPEKLWRAVFE